MPRSDHHHHHLPIPTHAHTHFTVSQNTLFLPILNNNNDNTTNNDNSAITRVNQQHKHGGARASPPTFGAKTQANIAILKQLISTFTLTSTAAILLLVVTASLKHCYCITNINKTPGIGVFFVIISNNSPGLLLLLPAQVSWRTATNHSIALFSLPFFLPSFHCILMVYYACIYFLLSHLCFNVINQSILLSIYNV